MILHGVLEVGSIFWQCPCLSWKLWKNIAREARNANDYQNYSHFKNSMFGFLYFLNKISLKMLFSLSRQWIPTHPYQTQRTLSSCLTSKIIKRIDLNLLSHGLIFNVNIWLIPKTQMGLEASNFKLISLNTHRIRFCKAFLPQLLYWLIKNPQSVNLTNTGKYKERGISL